MAIVSNSGRQKKAPSTGLFVVLAIVALGVAAILLFAKSKGPGDETDLPAAGVENGAEAGSAVKAASQGKTAGTAVGEISDGEKKASAGIMPPAVDGAENGAKVLSKEEEWRIADSNRLAKSEAIMLASAPKKHFDNDVENTIEVISKPGAQFLKVPTVDMDRDEVIEYLKKPVDIYEDDDEETVAAKERTAAFKAEALKFVEGGGTINQFIRDTVANQTEANETVEEIRREKQRILKTQGLEAAQRYLDEINPQLVEAGLPEVKIGRADLKLIKDQQKK